MNFISLLQNYWFKAVMFNEKDFVVPALNTKQTFFIPDKTRSLSTAVSSFHELDYRYCQKIQNIN